MPSPEHRFARRLDLTSLQLFAAVCEHGSIGRAAQQSFIAASAVSRRLSELEQAVGSTLLERQRRGVTPTAAGQALLHHARALDFGLQRMYSELAEYSGGVRGHVRMHANMSAIVQFLPEDLGAFAQRHPQIKIDLQEHLSGAVLQALQAGAADLGICQLGTSASQGALGLQSRPYRSDHLVLVMPQSHALSARAAIDFEEVLDCDIVGLQAGSSIGLAMQQAAARAGRSLRQRIQVTSLDAMCRMVANGLGLGLLPSRAFGLLQGLGPLVGVPLTDAWAQRELHLVARDFAALPLTARLLLEHLAPPLAPPHSPPSP